MAWEALATLDLLPTELLLQIFKHLDAETIIFGLRCVCKRFYSLAMSYDQYKLNFGKIAKKRFHGLCRLIDKNHVKSMVLSSGKRTPNQIALFVSAHRLSDYDHLQAITLHWISTEYLENLLEQIHRTCSIRSLSIRMESQSTCSSTVFAHLSAILAQKNLERLDLELGSHYSDPLTWPADGCSLKYLRWMDSIEYDVFVRSFALHLHCRPSWYKISYCWMNSLSQRMWFTSKCGHSVLRTANCICIGLNICCCWHRVWFISFWIVTETMWSMRRDGKDLSGKIYFSWSD